MIAERQPRVIGTEPAGRQSELDETAFASIVRSASQGALDELAGAPERTELLDGIFARMPGQIRRAATRGLDAVVHWHVGDRIDGGRDSYELVIRDGSCRVSRPPERPADASVRIGGVAFLKLMARAADAVALMRSGDLTVDGDVDLALRVERLLDRP